MAHVEIRRASIADAEFIAPRMREADALEVSRSGGYAPLEALVRSFMASEGTARTVVVDGEPAAMYGLVRLNAVSPIGVPWLLTTDAIERAPVAFFKAMRATLDGWLEVFPTLVQFVDEEHVSARRFLQALGFAIYPPVIHGAARAMFSPAVRSRHV
jgi:hypothetical protein